MRKILNDYMYLKSWETMIDFFYGPKNLSRLPDYLKPNPDPKTLPNPDPQTLANSFFRALQSRFVLFFSKFLLSEENITEK